MTFRAFKWRGRCNIPPRGGRNRSSHEGLPAMGARGRARGVSTPARPAGDIAHISLIVFARHIQCSGFVGPGLAPASRSPPGYAGAAEARASPGPTISEPTPLSTIECYMRLLAGNFQPHGISIAAKLFAGGVSCSSLQADVPPGIPILSQERPQVNRD